MVEWFKAAVLKTAEAQASGSSNLPLSAIYKSFSKNAIPGIKRKSKEFDGSDFVGRNAGLIGNHEQHYSGKMI